MRALHLAREIATWSGALVLWLLAGVFVAAVVGALLDTPEIELDPHARQR